MQLVKIWFILFLSFIALTSGKAQNKEVEKEILEIRKKYGLIHQRLHQLKSDTIDVFVYPTQEEMEEHPSGGIDKYVIFFSASDTLLIRHFYGQDEGGAFSTRIREVYLWDRKPFFYYDKGYTSWNYDLSEMRIYIANDKVIRKLTKNAKIGWHLITDDIHKVKTDSVQNTHATVDEGDMNVVESFLEESRQAIQKNGDGTLR